MPPVLPAAAVERAREIAESAPSVSDAKLTRLRMLMHGSRPDAPAAVASDGKAA